MATTVLDSLVVELGMDARGFEQGSRGALVSLEEFKKKIAETTNVVAGGVEKVDNIFGILKGNVLGWIATAIGLEQLGSFVNKVMQLDASTSRLARSLGMTTKELSTWQGVLRQVGGTAQDANALFHGLSSTLADIRLNLTMPSGPFAFMMQQMGLDMRRATPGQIMEKLPGFVQQRQRMGEDPMITTRLLEHMGLNEAAINALLSGRIDEFKKMMVGPLTKGQGQAAERLQEKEARVILNAERMAETAFPNLNKAIDMTVGAFEGLFATLKNSIAFFDTSGPRIDDTPRPGPVVTPNFTARPRQHHALMSSNNPGNVPYGQFARSQGAIRGDSNDFAVFPDEATGRRAAENLVQLRQSGDPAALRNAMGNTQSGVFPIPGRRSGKASSEHHTSVNINTFTVVSSRADPKEVAVAATAELRKLVINTITGLA